MDSAGSFCLHFGFWHCVLVFNMVDPKSKFFGLKVCLSFYLVNRMLDLGFALLDRLRGSWFL